MENKYKGHKWPIHILTRAEVHALIKACADGTPIGVRNRAFVVLLYRSMLRMSEALDLTTEDLDPERGLITVQSGKGGKRRTIGMDAKGWAYLSEWLVCREAMGLGKHKHVFCTIQGDNAGGRLLNVAMRSMLQRLGWKAGIKKRVHAHGLRHTGAVEAQRDWGDLTLLSQQLGHSDLTTTARYINHPQPERLIQKARERKW